MMTKIEISKTEKFIYPYVAERIIFNTISLILTKLLIYKKILIYKRKKLNNFKKRMYFFFKKF